MVKVLVISRGPFSSDNNTGNTLINLFSKVENLEIHNLYFRTEKPGRNPCKSIFQISEKQIIDAVLKKKPCGKLVEETKTDENEAKTEENVYAMAKKMNFYSLWFAREFLWMTGKWKKGNLKKYILDVNPDVIFMPVFGCWYPHKALAFIHKLTDAKIILFHADDNYTLKQFHFSPVYWIYRFILRKWVRRSVKISDVNCCISDIQKEEYQKAFGKECLLLQKKGNFDGDAPQKESFNEPLKLVYTGNVSSGRWESLFLISKALDKINAEKEVAKLHVYTASSLTNKMKKAFEGASVVFHGPVGASEVPAIQDDADILVHAESFRLKYSLEVRQSFSTKIVDYLAKGRCILAIGPAKVASMDYFIKNDGAFVITDKKDVENRLRALFADNGKIMREYALKAWTCGEKKHGESANDIKKILDKIL
ncbi:MAG: hypothetical protein J5844_00930 [Clostridia bacterium]|nr:hypothetical protein [Clostridia bacterium]